MFSFDGLLENDSLIVHRNTPIMQKDENESINNNIEEGDQFSLTDIVRRLNIFESPAITDIDGGTSSGERKHDTTSSMSIDSMCNEKTSQDEPSKVNDTFHSPLSHSPRTPQIVHNDRVTATGSKELLYSMDDFETEYQNTTLSKEACQRRSSTGMFTSKTDDQNTTLSKQVCQRRSSTGMFTGMVDAFTGYLIHGTKTFFHSNELYEGPFNHNGQRHGDEAVCTFLDGRGKFIGSYVNDEKKNGTLLTGKCTYTGTFKNDLYHSDEKSIPGILIFSDGTVYEGCFQSGLYHGYGKLASKAKGNVYIYEGEFKKGKKHGIGKINYQDGERKGYSYDGEWMDDYIHGEGVEMLYNNETYEGFFVNGLREGRGRLTSPQDGMMRAGMFYQGQLQDGDNTILVFKDGITMYEGAIFLSQPFGKGKMTYACPSSGDIMMSYEGDFINGLRHGYGVCTYGGSSNDQVIYEGQWNGDEIMGYTYLSANEIRSKIILDDKSNVQISYSNSRTHPILIVKSEVNETDFDTTKKSVNIIGNSSGSCTSESSKSCHTREASSEDLSSCDNATYINKPVLVHYSNSDTYCGRLDKNSNRIGIGTYSEYKTGIIYEGKWREKRNGKGKTTYPWGIVYIGRYVRNVMEGDGQISLMDGSNYKGNFKGGVFDGVGKLKNMFTGSEYIGEFVRGKYEGIGEETLKDGSKYIGHFQKGKRSGLGRLIEIQDGIEKVIYNGNWKDNLKDGYGNFTYTNGDRYKGGFTKDLRCGRGIFLKEDGWKLDGEWNEDRPLNGDWVLSHNDHYIYYGVATIDNSVSLKENRNIPECPIPYGFGTLKDIKNKELFTGYFVNGKKCGHGVCVFQDGTKWDGEWDKDEFVRYSLKRP